MHMYVGIGVSLTSPIRVVLHGCPSDHHLFRIGSTGAKDDYRYDSSDSTGSSHPDGPKCPLDTEDQSYVPTGRMLHVFGSVPEIGY
ncbi:hypothetical protein IC575_026165 [Cucumis melo]